MEQTVPTTTTDIFLTNDYSVQVTLTGEDLDPDLVTTLLTIEPTTTGRRGEERRVTPEGERKLWESGVWSHEVSSSDDVTECRDHQLLSLVDAIEPQLDRLRGAGLERIYFYYTLASSIGLMNVRLRPETMRRLGAIDADLYVSCFDCFNPEHEYWKEG